MCLSVCKIPYIAGAVCTLGKHVQEPRPIHWEAVKRILRYLKGTQNEGLVFQASSKQHTPTFKLTIHVDADWGTDPQNRYSRTGVLCQVNENTLRWKSHKQSSVAVSGCEAEYMALFEGSKDTGWLRNLLSEFNTVRVTI
jgi:hypothetical protein